MVTVEVIIERKWSMPSKNTFGMPPVEQLLEQEVNDGIWVDPFANVNKWGTVTNDLNEKFDTDYHMDALDFLKMFNSNSVDGVLFDPPYSPRQVKEMYESVGAEVTKEQTQSRYWSGLKCEIARIVKPMGKVISFGWNSQGIGKQHGFSMKRILLIPHGSQHNDTICVVEQKCVVSLLP